VLFPRPALDGIARGEITLAFRRWDRPRVRPGTHLRTAIGLVAVESVTEVEPDELTEDDARLAGHADLADLAGWLGRHPSADGAGRGRRVYRVGVRHGGDDPRIALRQDADLSPADVEAILARLGRLDRASPRGPWTATVLRLIADHPGVRAADLAAGLGRETLSFKADVRKLKELGLTESLEVGYRLSPRGGTVLSRLGP
jgi:hypothetical protein